MNLFDFYLPADDVLVLEYCHTIILFYSVYQTSSKHSCINPFSLSNRTYPFRNR